MNNQDLKEWANFLAELKHPFFDPVGSTSVEFALNSKRCALTNAH